MISQCFHCSALLEKVGKLKLLIPTMLVFPTLSHWRRAGHLETWCSSPRDGAQSVDFLSITISLHRLLLVLFSVLQTLHVQPSAAFRTDDQATKGHLEHYKETMESILLVSAKKIFKVCFACFHVLFSFECVLSSAAFLPISHPHTKFFSNPLWVSEFPNRSKIL